MITVAVIAATCVLAVALTAAVTIDRLHERSTEQEAKRFESAETKVLRAQLRAAIKQMDARCDSAEADAKLAADAVRKAGLVKVLGRPR